MLSGDNGVLQRATDAKEKTVIAQEEENAKLTFTEVQMELAQGKTVESNQFQKIVDGNFGTGNATGTIGGGSYIITVARTGINYQMDSNGNISTLNEVPIDFAPGILEGNGTENNPYVINSVEDLLAFAYNVNSKKTSYENEYVTLGRNLDLKDENSYVDATTKYSLKKNDYYDLGYIPDEESNYSVMDCMTGCYEGKAFISIGNKYNLSGFKGKFNGNNHYIKNIDSRFETYVGLFGNIEGNSEIRNLGIESGQIITKSTGGYAGGVIAYINSSSNVIIDNCYNKSAINGSIVGGIIGFNDSQNSEITNCYNTGSIVYTYRDQNSDGAIGGIIGYINYLNDNPIKNCFNTGNISTSVTNWTCDVGGISGNGSNEIINCWNSGTIYCNHGYASGITGRVNQDSIIDRCYNMGNVITVNGMYTSGIGNWWMSDSFYGEVTNCFNSGAIVSQNSSYPSSGIASFVTTNRKIEFCHNKGSIVNSDANKAGEIVYNGNVNSNNDYLIKKDDDGNNINANANGATAKTQEEMDEIMSVQNFLNLMNSYVSENNADSTKTKLKTWKLENELPVFDN